VGELRGEGSRDFDERKRARHVAELHGVMRDIYSAYDFAEGETCDDIGSKMKDAITQWSGSYYVAYALIMTIGFAMLFVNPIPRAHPSLEESRQLRSRLHWRPESDDLDAVALFLYYAFTLAVCYDTTWATLLSAEWGIRAPITPGNLFPRFMSSLSASPNRETWGLHCLDHRARVGKQIFGCNLGSSQHMLMCGAYSYASYDGYFLMDRVVNSLFGAAALYLYLTQGLCHCIMCLMFHANLVMRTKHLGVVQKARHNHGMHAPKQTAPAEDVPPEASMI
jgi:hypothetical protein